MPCPTCDHTMELLASSDPGSPRRDWWCPRCGTLMTRTTVLVPDQHGGKSVADVRDDVAAPKLVERCRTLLAHTVQDRGVHPGAESLLGVLHQLGVTEAVHKPEGRP